MYMHHMASISLWVVVNKQFRFSFEIINTKIDKDDFDDTDYGILTPPTACD